MSTSSLGKIIVGYREGLDQFWWHRVAAVMFALASMALFVSVTSDHIGDQPESSPMSDVILDINLTQFLGWEYKDGSRTKLDEFPMIDYFEGVQEGDRITRANPYSFLIDECTVVKYSPYGGNPSVRCEGSLETPDKTFRYKLSRMGLAKVWVRAGLIAAGICAALWVIAANLYYQGLVYILRGPRKA